MESGRPSDVDVVVIGAGVAGCAAAIALRRTGLRIALLESSAGPHARFCGEFVSGEALESLARLGVSGSLAALGANPIRRLELHAGDGGCFPLALAAGGFGLTRRALDAALLGRAVRHGTEFFPGMQVTAVSGRPGRGFRVEALADGDRAHVFSARAVVGAHGKRSAVDRVLGRRFLAVRSDWVGVRRHYRGVQRGDAVALYLFPGGYCGAVSVDDGLTTLALLAGRRALKECGDRPEQWIERARAGNPGLREWLDRAAAVPDSLMAISRISFEHKEPVVDGVFMVGDSAGVSAPFLGIGVANALGSALACSDAVGSWLGGAIAFEQARRDYQRWWRRGRPTRSLSRLASSMLCRPAAGNAAVCLLNQIPWAARTIYRTSRAGRPAVLYRAVDDCPPATLLEPMPGDAASRVRKAGR
jgi:flavin-dependent dehydrogenase